MSSIPLSRAQVEQAGDLDFDRKRTPARPDLLLTIHAAFDSYPVDIQVVGDIGQLPALTKRLRELGAEPFGSQPEKAPAKAPRKPLAAPEYNDAGEALCPIHHKALKPSKFSGMYCPVKDPGTGGYCGYKLDEG